VILMDDRLKDGIVSAVQRAGSRLKSSTSSDKAPHEIARRCRGIMLQALQSSAPMVGMLGERPGDDSGLTICPLDAMLNFSRGIDGYGVMAAYIESGVPLYGALYMPESDELFLAERGKGVRLNGRKVGSASRRDISRALVCCECGTYDEDMRPHASGVIEALARNGIPWRNLGSPASAFTAFAVGRIDGFIAPCQDSAHAAGYLIMQEAGALVTGKDDRDYTIYSGSVVAANPELHERLLEIVGKALHPCK
jgi:myo-inositol-1(or 4)-monophosphatase